MDKTEIIKLVQNNIPFFRKQWQTFCDMVEEYAEHVVECQKKPELRIDTKKEMERSDKREKLWGERNILIQKSRIVGLNGDETTMEGFDKPIKKKTKEIQNLKLELKPPEPGYERYGFRISLYLNIPNNQIFWITPAVNPLNYLLRDYPPEDDLPVVYDCALLSIVHDYGNLIALDKRVFAHTEYEGYFKRGDFCEAVLSKLRKNPDSIYRAFERVQDDCTLPDPQEKDGQSKTNITDYKALNPAKVPISRLIEQGESYTLEFKETLDYDTQNKGKSKDILLSSLKTIAGFLNAAGGTLLIGVDDSGKIKGIGQDLSLMKNGNNNKFQLKIQNCLKDRFQSQPFGKVNISFEKFPEGTICRVDVQASEDIIHLDNRVYVRDGNTTQLLKGRRLTDWIQQRKLLTALPSGK